MRGVQGRERRPGRLVLLAHLRVRVRVRLRAEPTAAENAEQEKQLLAALEKLLEAYSNYDAPYLRKDGDIVIPLDAILKNYVLKILEQRII